MMSSVFKNCIGGFAEDTRLFPEKLAAQVGSTGRRVSWGGGDSSFDLAVSFGEWECLRGDVKFSLRVFSACNLYRIAVFNSVRPDFCNLVFIHHFCVLSFSLQ